MFIPKPNKKYKGYLESRSGKFFKSRSKAEEYFLRHYAPDGWERHGKGYWLLGALIEAALGWVDDDGNRHVEVIR